MSNNFTDLLTLRYSVFPIPRTSKKPKSSWKKYQTQKALCKEAQEWHQSQNNIAIVTGSISGFFVFDIDGEEGEKTLKRLESENDSLPRTVTSKTGNGRHLFFKQSRNLKIGNHTGKTKYGEVVSGIDIRGNGGYIVAPPSLHPNGKNYQWVHSPFDTEVADAPKWLLDMFVENTSFNNQLDAEIQNQCSILESTKEGGRNHQLNTSAYILGKWIINQSDKDKVISSLTKSALKIGLGNSEISKTIQSGLEAGKAEAERLNDKWINPDLSITEKPKLDIPECPYHLLAFG